MPNQWNGSVQQYFHFLLGYLAPVTEWHRKHRDGSLAVRDCGPMNRWFDLLRPEADLEIMTVGDVLHVLAGDLQPTKILKGMDYPEEFSGDRIRRFADFTRDVAQARLPSHPPARRILVSDRASSDDFFATPAAEWPESGSQKRSVPNLTHVVDSWNRVDLQILDGATTDIHEQILAHSSAQILVGQHGAGLTNMLWMAPGSCVVEILPPMPADAQHIFANLARVLNINYFRVEQDTVHAPIDGGALHAALVAAENSLS